jgi:hypothetical protein
VPWEPLSVKDIMSTDTFPGPGHPCWLGDILVVTASYGLLPVTFTNPWLEKFSRFPLL